MLTSNVIDILSEAGTTFKWENTGTIGNLIVDEISNLNVKVILDPPKFNLKYTPTTSLPQGLTLNFDGTIQGKHTDDFVGNSTYLFNVSVTDATGFQFTTESFAIDTVKTTSTNFITAVFKPYLNLNDRKKYKDFINDKSIFIPDLIYRNYDSNFGVQRDLHMTLNFGISDLPLQNYQTQIDSGNFERRRIKLGSLKTAIAKENNKEIYEIIYVEVIDDYNINNLMSTSTSFVFNGRTYYPPSINNMRQRFRNSPFQIETTENLNPKFTKTPQGTDFKILGYIPFVPVCYCLPGKSIIILKNIQNSGFKFNTINFEIDRIFLKDKYLLFSDRN